MAPKKVVSEEKKKLAPSGVSTQKFFGKRVPAAPASGEQAESSSPASTAAAQPKPKPMSSSEAVTAIMATPTSSDAELDLTLSQSSTQSVQETEQSGDQAQSVQLPDVGAEQEVEISVAQDPPPSESLATRYPARKRKGTISTPQSSPSTTSDDGDMDMDWTPAESGRGEETGSQGKRKVPESLRVMEDDDDDDEEHDDDEPVIVAVDIGESNIAVPRVAPPASIFLKPQQRPTVTTASVQDIPPAQSQSQKTHPTTTSTSSSGFSSSLSTKKFRSPVWDFFTVSKDGEHIAVCTLCHKEVRRGKPGTHLGTGGQLTHLKNNHAIRWEQHLKNIAERSPCVEGEGTRGTSAASEIIVVVGGDEEEEFDILPTEPSTPVSSSLSAQCPATPTSATSQWHKTHSERVVKRGLSLPAPTVPKSAASVAPQKIKKKIQATIPSLFWSEGPYDRNHPTALLYNGKLAKMLALDLLPFSFVEGKGFLEFVAAICPKWKVPSRNYFSRVAIPALHGDVIELVGQALRKSFVHTIHLTTDMWTSSTATDYMCITAHWNSFTGVNQRLKAGLTPEEAFKGARQHATVAMFAMEHAHTAANILEEFNTKVSEWLQPRRLKIGFVSTDNGSNIVKAMRDGGYFRVLCLAHCINLVVQDFLKKEDVANDILVICRKICTHFSHSFKARKQLRIIQRGKREPVKALIQEVQTRWNSTYYMLDRLYEQCRSINDYIFERKDLKNLAMERDKWELVKCMTQMLHPFEVFTCEVSKEDSTMGQAIPLLRMLETQLKKVSARFTPDEEGHDLFQKLMSRFKANARLQDEILKSKEYICATILDPRYKPILYKFFAFSDNDVADYKSWIVERASKFEEERLTIREPTHSSSTVPPSTPKEASLASKRTTTPPSSSFRAPATEQPQSTTSALSWFQSEGLQSSKDVTEIECAQTAPMTIERMCNEYLDDPQKVFVDQNPLIYWYGKIAQWPELSRLAINYLACPLASVSSERVFSAAGAVVSVRRSSLSPQNVERLTMIKMNQHFIPPNYSVRETLPEEDEESWVDIEAIVLADKLRGEQPDFEDELFFPD